MDSLFPQLVEPDVPAERRVPEHGPGLFAGVAMERGIDHVLDYAVPARLASHVQVGQRVRVPLGRKNRPAHGVVVYLRDTSDHPPGKIKNVLDIDDERALLTPGLIELALWMSRYYVAPLGTVIESIIPSAVKKKVGLGFTRVVRLAKSRAETQTLLEKTKAPKRRAILARMLQLEGDDSAGIELAKLAGESGTTVPTVQKLVGLGLISIKREFDLPRLTADVMQSGGDELDLSLNDDQRRAFDELRPRMDGGFSVNLLHGVTGSGKTEVYLQCIRQVVALGRQAIVLVPEIALTPQTVRRFTARFRRVAVLHSGLTATERHRFWQQIAQGQADVVVGARSAIFAPLPKLGVIVVDEEHESSYKQDTSPRYHARDVSIKRAQIERIPVILGSATPALESFHRVSGSGFRVSGKDVSDAHPTPETRHPKPDYRLLSLPRRVRGLELPYIELVDMHVDNRLWRGVHLISSRLEHMLRTTIQQGHQAILLLNRRGYSNFVHCTSCQHVMQCKYCDTTLVFHRSAGMHPAHATAAEGAHTGQLHCHYCLAVNPLPAVCPQCGKKLSLFGLGTQRVEEELSRKMPELKFARVDSDSMRGGRDYEKTLASFARKEIQVMLGTQMIAKGLDYPNVTLVGVISGDTALSLPDFRAAERTFQLITQVAGRAGRGSAPGRVILQTFMPDDPTIQAAIKQDYERFATSELKHRREVGLPPFARMVRIIIRDQDLDKLDVYAEQLAAKLSDAIAKEGGTAGGAGAVAMKGPMPCPIGRIAGYFRYQIVLTSQLASRLQNVLATVREKGGLARAERIAVDVDPVSLL